MTWVRGESATMWVYYDLGRKILAEKPLIMMGRSATPLRFNLGRKFKCWPMKLTGIPEEVKVEDLQR